MNSAEESGNDRESRTAVPPFRDCASGLGRRRVTRSAESRAVVGTVETGSSFYGLAFIFGLLSAGVFFVASIRELARLQRIPFTLNCANALGECDSRQKFSFPASS